MMQTTHTTGRLWRLAGGLAAALLIAGCGGDGGGGELGAVKETLRGYVTAVIDGRGDDACAYFTDAMRQRTLENLRRNGTDARTCGEAMTAASLDLTPQQKDVIRDFGDFTTTVTGRQATVRLAQSGRVTNLVKSDDRWLIASELAR